MTLLEIGKEIRKIRRKVGMSQKKLSSMTGIDRAHISRIENGIVIGVTYNSIVKIFDVLGMSLIIVKQNESIDNSLTK